jgi:chromate transporter
VERVKLSSIFWIFIRLGSLGFGGPIALISLMEQECSRKRGWLTLEEFNERYVFCKLLPGPVASQMAMWMGYHVRGRIGAVVAGVAFLIPAFTLILLLSMSYAGVVALPNVAPLIQGMEAGALVIIFDSVVRMFRPYYREWPSWCFLVVAAFLMLFIPRWEPLIILLGGLLVIGVRFARKAPRTVAGFAPVSIPLLVQIFWIHFKAGFTVFGTGLAVVPVLQHEVVDLYHWMSTKEFIDGIAFGQITPGPVTITSVFVGYRTAGLAGAFAGCLGMYLPGLILILFVMPLVYERLKGRPFLADFQRGAIPTVIGCILGATLLLGKVTITTVPMATLTILLGVMALSLRIPGWGVILLGCVINFSWTLLFGGAT